MKLVHCSVLASILGVMPGFSSAYENSAFGGHQEDCFAKAMIGMDSVINSRLGVPAEHALELTALHPQPAGTDGRAFDSATLNVILSAYLWEDSPHAYAVEVFYKCAQQQSFPQQASVK
ncbi:MAG TPA: hypothetical protein VIM41_06495 [Gammaproteobacteria bacterium]